MQRTEWRTNAQAPSTIRAKLAREPAQHHRSNSTFPVRATNWWPYCRKKAEGDCRLFGGYGPGANSRAGFGGSSLARSFDFGADFFPGTKARSRSAHGYRNLPRERGGKSETSLEGGQGKSPTAQALQPNRDSFPDQKRRGRVPDGAL